MSHLGIGSAWFSMDSVCSLALLSAQSFWGVSLAVVSIVSHVFI